MSEVKCEWGTIGNINFLSSSQVTSHDETGNIINCDKCPNQAGYHEVGIDHSINLCSAHSPYADIPPAQFIYKHPSESKPPRITEDLWVIKICSSF